MARIEALLVTDGTQASDAARQKLTDSGINFRELKGGKVEGVSLIPTVVAREGDFSGTERISQFVEIVTNRPQV